MLEGTRLVVSSCIVVLHVHRSGLKTRLLLKRQTKHISTVLSVFINAILLISLNTRSCSMGKNCVVCLSTFLKRNFFVYRWSFSLTCLTSHRFCHGKTLNPATALMIVTMPVSTLSSVCWHERVRRSDIGPTDSPKSSNIP